MLVRSVNDYFNAVNEAELGNYAKMIAGRANYDELYAQKKYQLQYESAKREKALNIFSAIIDTAGAIVGYLKDPSGPAGLALSILAGITGATQIATIATTPLPVPPSGNTGAKISGSVTEKFHSGGVAGQTPDTPRREQEITRTLLSTERVLSPQQTSIFDSMINRMSSMGGTAGIVGGIGVTTDSDRMYIAMSKALRNMPAPIMTWQEFERQRDRQERLRNNAIIK
jgi:hypothetical protein